jgi:hypothetical protein
MCCRFAATELRRCRNRGKPTKSQPSIFGHGELGVRHATEVGVEPSSYEPSTAILQPRRSTCSFGYSSTPLADVLTFYTDQVFDDLTR